MPSYDTVRRLKALPWQVVVLAREGEEALARTGHSTRAIARPRRLRVRQIQRILARHRARPEA